MARLYYLNGNTMVTADGSELGIAESSITIAINPKHKDITVSTFGDIAPETQAFLADATIAMALVNVDPDIIERCLRKSMASNTLGTMPIAGTLMGANSFFVSLRMASPTGGRPWTFPAAYLTGSPFSWPLGNEKSVITMNWRAIPYQADPSTAAGAVLFNRT